MSIDYDRMGELLEQWQHGDEVRDQLEAQWEMELAAPDMARELLRLRGGVEVIRDYCAAAAKSAESAGIRTLAREMETHAKALTDLLNGDTE